MAVVLAPPTKGSRKVTTGGRQSLGRPAPSEQYIKALHSRLEAMYQDDNTQIDLMRKVRLLQNDVGALIPEELRTVDVEVRDPTITDEVQRVTATLSLNRARCQVIPASPSDAAQNNATLREHWTEGTLRRAGRAEFGIDTFSASMDACIGDGGAWCKLLYLPHVWEERNKLRLKQFSDDLDEDGNLKRTAASQFTEAVEDAKKGAGPPFAWISCDVRNCYPRWDGARLAEMLEVSERPYVDIADRYGVGIDDDRRILPGVGPPLSEPEAWKLGTSFTFYEYWNEEWAVYMCEGPASRTRTQNTLIVSAFRHGYGRVPYFFAPGLMPNHWRGRKVGWGVSMNKLWLTQFRDFLLTLLAQAAAKDIGTPIVEEREPLAAEYRGDDTRPDGTEPDAVGLAQWLHLPPGVRVHPLFSDTISQNFQTTLALINTMIDRVDTPRIAGQIGGGLEGAGFAINQVLSEAKIKHSTFMKNYERMLVELTEFLWHLVRVKIKETVYVTYGFDGAGEPSVRGWKGLGPDDLRQPVDLYWHLDPEQPSAKIIEARYWHERLNAGTIDWDTAVEAMGQNPDEVRRGKARDAIRASEVYKKTLEQMAYQEIGRGDVVELAMQVAKTGLLPGMPGGPQLPGAEAPPGAVPPATDNLQPDQGAQAMSPNGAGAAPISPQTAGIGPGAVVPQQAAAAGIQSLGP